jgi:arylsulfatase A-like enzyme
VNQTDDSIGQVLDALDQYGFADNTLVIVTSDNGSPGYAEADSPTASVMDRYGHHPSGPWRGMKGDAHEGGHRVPLLARWPGHIPAGTTCDETVCLVDLMATFAAITGGQLPADAAEDSYNILPALLAESHDQPLREATVHHALIGMFAIRQGPWKLILGLGSGGFTMPQNIAVADGPIGRNGVVGQLFNLEEDPQETRNLYQARPEVVRRLNDKLDEYRKSGRSAPLTH